MRRVGICSICGGDVVGVRGPWWSVSPPPPDACLACGARAASDVIKMVSPPNRITWTSHTVTEEK